MKKIVAFTLLASAALMFSGCGGSDNPRFPNLYEGAWSGTWAGPETNDGGTVDFTIDTYGNITGTMNRGAAIAGTVVGTVNGSGKFDVTSSFATGGNFSIDGQMAESTPSGGTETLTGNFTYLWNERTYDGNFSQTPKVSTPTTAGSTGQ